MKHPERVEDYLEHIAEAIRRAMEYAQEIHSLEALEQNRQAQDAIVRNITVIGEAANQIQKAAPEFINRHPELPWKEIRGMRNAIVHDYFDIGWQRVLVTVKSDLPPLLQQIEHAITDAKKNREAEP
jgi:uncharacterized protein with HEPN domain